MNCSRFSGIIESKSSAKIVERPLATPDLSCGFKPSKKLVDRGLAFRFVRSLLPLRSICALFVCFSLLFVVLGVIR
jgi:hypothetical protein